MVDVYRDGKISDAMGVKDLATANRIVHITTGEVKDSVFLSITKTNFLIYTIV